jgi:hypothetical protein
LVDGGGSFEPGKCTEFVNSSGGSNKTVEVFRSRFAGGKNGPNGVQFGHRAAERVRNTELGIPHHGTKVTGRK